MGISCSTIELIGTFLCCSVVRFNFSLMQLTELQTHPNITHGNTCVSFTTSTTSIVGIIQKNFCSPVKFKCIDTPTVTDYEIILRVCRENVHDFNYAIKNYNVFKEQKRKAESLQTKLQSNSAVQDKSKQTKKPVVTNEKKLTDEDVLKLLGDPTKRHIGVLLAPDSKEEEEVDPSNYASLYLSDKELQEIAEKRSKELTDYDLFW